MNLVLAIAAGGAIGAMGRHFVNQAAFHLLGTQFPWGTVIVNVAGSFLMGVLIEVIALKWSVSREMQAFLATGILGAFTTFSTFSLDVAMLNKSGSLHIMFFYIALSVLGAIGALFLGLYLVRSLVS